MKTTLKLHVEQIEDAVLYRGYLDIAKHRFDYELRCIISLEEIDCVGASGCVQEFCCFFELGVKKYGIELELEREEYILFLQMIVPFVIGFYNSPRVRQYNDLTGHAIESVSFTGGEITFDFPIEFCRLLNNSKFNCQIPA
jgi:hypothetical protein